MIARKREQRTVYPAVETMLCIIYLYSGNIYLPQYHQQVKVYNKQHGTASLQFIHIVAAFNKTAADAWYSGGRKLNLLMPVQVQLQIHNGCLELSLHGQ